MGNGEMMMELSEMVEGIADLFAECAVDSEFLPTEYTFVQQGVPVVRPVPAQVLITFLSKIGQLEPDEQETECQLMVKDDIQVGFHAHEKNCIRCGSPEARYVGVQIYSRYDQKTKESHEIGERLEQYCDECIHPPGHYQTCDAAKQITADSLGISWQPLVNHPIPRPTGMEHAVNSDKMTANIDKVVGKCAYWVRHSDETVFTRR